MIRFRFSAPGGPRIDAFRNDSGLLVPRGRISVSKTSRAERALNRTTRERAAAMLERDLADVLVGFREGIEIGQAEAAVFAGDARVIVNALVPNELEAQLVAVLGHNLEGALESGVHVGLRFAPPVLGNVPLTLATDAAIAHVERQAASAALGLTQGTQAGIRQVIVAGLGDGIAPVEVARRVGDLAGLLPRQVTAVENFRAGMVKRLVPVPEALTPQVQRVIDQEVAKFRDRQLLMRGRMIAETETQFAITAGEQAFWNQAVSEGAVDAELVFKTWRTVLDSKVCHICEPLHGQVVPFGETFFTLVGARIGPPAHPRCRCYIEWAEKDQPSRRPDRGARAVAEQQGRRFLDPAALREDLVHTQGQIQRASSRLSRVRLGSRAANRIEASLGASRATAARIQSRIIDLEVA